MTSSACKETPAFDVRASIVNNLVFVETKVNDASPSLFLLDTAAATSVIDKAIAEGIGLSGSGGPLDLSTGGGSVEGSKLSKVELRIGDNVRVSDSNVVALDLRSLGEGLGVPVGGILGFEVFRKYVVAIDYDDQRVTFQHPDDYRPGSDAQMLAVHLEDNIPFIDVKRAEQWSGMSLAAQGAGFRAYHVRSVVVGSQTTPEFWPAMCSSR
jgi:hypothetical protein